MQQYYDERECKKYLMDLNEKNVNSFLREFNELIDSDLYSDICKLKNLTKIVVNSVNKNGSNFMHWLAAKDSEKIFNHLVKSGAYFDVKDNDGNSPLHTAAKRRSHDVIKLIMKLDVDYASRENKNLPLEFEIINKNGFTPFDYSMQNDDKNALNIFSNASNEYWSNRILSEKTKTMFLGNSYESILPKTNNAVISPNWYEASSFKNYNWISDPTAQIVNFANNQITQRFCSGFLIDKDLFLTAGHCIGEICYTHQQTDNLRITFNYQYPYVDIKDKQPKGEIKEVKFKIQSFAEHGTCNGIDYGIYKLESDSAYESFGKTSLATYIPENNTKMVISQHPDGVPKKIAFGNIVATNSTSGTISYNADTQGGSSGSPVGDNDAGGEKVFGVHIEGGAKTNTAISIKKISEQSEIVKNLTNLNLFNEKQNNKKQSSTNDFNHGNTKTEEKLRKNDYRGFY